MKKKMIALLTAFTLLVAMAACAFSVSAADSSANFQNFTGNWYPLASLTPERGTLTGHFSSGLNLEISDAEKAEVAQSVRTELTQTLYPAGTDETDKDIRNENFEILWTLCQSYGIEPADSEVSTDAMRLSLLQLFSQENYGEIVFEETATPQQAIEAMAQEGYRSFYVQLAYYLEYYGIQVNKYDKDEVVAKINALFPDRDVEGFDPYVNAYQLKLNGVGDGTLHFDFSLDADARFGYPDWFREYVDLVGGEIPLGDYWMDLSPEDFAGLTVHVLVNDEELTADATGFDVPLAVGDNEVKLLIVKEAAVENEYDIAHEYTVNITVSDEGDSSEPSENPDSSVSEPEAEKPDGSKGDGSSSQPESPSSQSSTGGKTLNNSSATKVPNTGDVGVAGLVVLALTAGAAVLVFRKKHS